MRCIAIRKVGHAQFGPSYGGTVALSEVKNHAVLPLTLQLSQVIYDTNSVGKILMNKMPAAAPPAVAAALLIYHSSGLSFSGASLALLDTITRFLRSISMSSKETSVCRSMLATVPLSSHLAPMTRMLARGRRVSIPVLRSRRHCRQ